MRIKKLLKKTAERPLESSPATDLRPVPRGDWVSAHPPLSSVKMVIFHMYGLPFIIFFIYGSQHMSPHTLPHFSYVFFLFKIEVVPLFKGFCAGKLQNK